jgi:hypothetical protein
MIKESASAANLETIVEELSPSSLSKSSVRIDMTTSNTQATTGIIPPKFAFDPPTPTSSVSFASPRLTASSFPNSPLRSQGLPGNIISNMSSSLGNNCNSSHVMTSGINCNKNTKVKGKDLLSIPSDPLDPTSFDEIESLSTSFDGSRLPGRLERLEIEGGPINPSKTRRKSSILSIDKLFRHKIGSLPDSTGNARQSIVSRLSFSSHPDDNELRVTNFNRLTDLRKILNPEEEKEDLWAAFWARFNSCDWFDWNLNNAAKLITIGVFVVTIILVVKAIINSGSI